MKIQTFLAYLGWTSTFGSMWAALLFSAIKGEVQLGIYLFVFIFSLAVAAFATSYKGKESDRKEPTVLD